MNFGRMVIWQILGAGLFFMIEKGRSLPLLVGYLVVMAIAFSGLLHGRWRPLPNPFRRWKSQAEK